MIPTNDLVEGSFRLLETDTRVVLPEAAYIRTLISATDVIHSWAIPSFGIKVDACPGRLSQASIFIKREGVFLGQCSEICGVNHGFMPIVVVGTDANTFNNWYQETISADDSHIKGLLYYIPENPFEYFYIRNYLSKEDADRLHSVNLFLGSTALYMTWFALIQPAAIPFSPLAVYTMSSLVFYHAGLSEGYIDPSQYELTETMYTPFFKSVGNYFYNYDWCGWYNWMAGSK